MVFKNYTKNLQSKTKLILSISTLLIFVFFGFNYLFSPKTTQINMIDSKGVKFGSTQLSGVLQKDTAVGVEGNYFIILPTGKPTLLDVQGFDSLVSQEVEVLGILSPGSTNDLPYNMSVTSIKLK